MQSITQLRGDNGYVQHDQTISENFMRLQDFAGIKKKNKEESK